MKTLSSIILLVCLFTASASDPTKKQTNTPDYSWLAGTWIGDGFGGTSEEVWTAPDPHGTMIGVYRHHDAAGTPVFYEFMVLDSAGLRLKHFGPDLIGWESKEEFENFEMISHNSDKIEFQGLVYERKSDEEMEITLKLQNGDQVDTEVFKMKRKQM